MTYEQKKAKLNGLLVYNEFTNDQAFLDENKDNDTVSILNLINYWDFKRRKKIKIPYATRIYIEDDNTYTIKFLKADAGVLWVIKNVPIFEVKTVTYDFFSIAQRLSAPTDDKRNKRTTLLEELDRLMYHGTTKFKDFTIVTNEKLLQKLIQEEVPE